MIDHKYLNLSSCTTALFLRKGKICDRCKSYNVIDRSYSLWQNVYINYTPNAHLFFYTNGGMG